MTNVLPECVVEVMTSHAISEQPLRMPKLCVARVIVDKYAHQVTAWTRVRAEVARDVNQDRSIVRAVIEVRRDRTFEENAVNAEL